ncbi:TRAP transporter permease [Stappia indica]|uniref:TRAP transporter fused permease subunit n=1 Tax=Stappia indica TaxID=538381 RepID=A0A857CDS4_9HYPH|nr:TRAP transporter fused permease subunit [Stappia indica]QGZ36602.1 TRAP transporter fused permease subunit [Stappia indica]
MRQSLDGSDAWTGVDRLFAGLRTAFAVSIPLLAVGFCLDGPRRLGYVIYDEQFLALLVGLCLALVFLSTGARGTARKGAAPWYDVLAAVTGLGVCLYIASDYEGISIASAMDPMVHLFPALAVILLLLEGVRRVAGFALTAIILVFLVYGLWGYLMPAPLTGQQVSPQRLAVQIAFDPSAILGTALFICATAVVTFILFGAILEKAGGTEFFNDISLALFGGYRGGAAKIAVTSSALMGSISGSAVANVVSSGVVTIPLMKRSGYRAQTAAAVETVASTGGQLAPPVMGAAAFLMADFLQVDYSEVVLAALIPALLYFLSIFFQVDLAAARRGLRALSKSELPSARAVMAKGWIYPLPFVVLIVAMFWLHLRVEEAALWACASLMPILLWRKGGRRSPGDLFSAFASAGQSSTSVILIAAAAGIIIGILNLTGLSFSLTRILTTLGENNLFLLLLLSAALSIVLGMGMPTVGVYVLLATLVTPSMIKLGVEPIAAHMFVLYFGMMSMITPPVAVAAFSAATLASSPPMRTAMEATVMAWPAFVVPFLFVFSPTLLGVGPAVSVVASTVTALAGVWCVTASVVGYIREPAGPLSRLIIFACGAALLMPTDLFPGALLVNIAGLAAMVAMLLWSSRSKAVSVPVR